MSIGVVDKLINYEKESPVKEKAPNKRTPANVIFPQEAEPQTEPTPQLDNRQELLDELLNFNLEDYPDDELRKLKEEKKNAIFWGDSRRTNKFIPKEPFAFFVKNRHGFNLNVQVIEIINRHFAGEKTFDLGYMPEKKAIVLKPSPTGIPVNGNLEKKYYYIVSCKRFLTAVFKLDSDIKESCRFRVSLDDIPHIGKCLVIHLDERVV